MPHSPKRLKMVVIHWVDIEQEAGWGEGAKELPVVVQAGFIHARPNKRQKIPVWKIKGSRSEEEPGPPACSPWGADVGRHRSS